eukprot:scaffold215778_cov15-Tisochrysis_lutea.AAC.1
MAAAALVALHCLRPALEVDIAQAVSRHELPLCTLSFINEPVLAVGLPLGGLFLVPFGLELVGWASSTQCQQ